MISAMRVTAVRFELVDRVVTLPAASLKMWESLSGTEEKILIHTANGRVIVVGRGLDAVHEALDTGRLQALRESPGASVALDDDPRIQAITIEMKFGTPANK